MKPNGGLITGSVIIAVIVIYYGYLTWSALQSPPVDQSQVAVTAPTLDQTALEDIRSKNINGNLPITLNNGDLDNPAPFLSR